MLRVTIDFGDPPHSTPLHLPSHTLPTPPSTLTGVHRTSTPAYQLIVTNTMTPFPILLREQHESVPRTTQ